MNVPKHPAPTGWHKSAWVIILIITLFWLPVPTKHKPEYPVRNYLRQTNFQDCSQIIAELKSNPEWLERLYDPILKTLEDVERTTEKYSQIFECLLNSPVSLDEEENQILRLTGYYLMFVDGLYADPDGRHLQIVDLETVEDPAVSKIKEDLNIPVPEGYIFVNLFDSTEAMPQPIREIFEKRNVAGVTVFSRYIAVLDQEKSNWYEQALKSQVLPTTISHELIHAYINSNLGSEGFSTIPTWFHEGVAIYFSKSGENRAVITPNFTLYITPPADYQQYALNFKYLEHELGRDTFLSRVQQVIETRDTGSLFNELPFNNENELPVYAAAWQQQEVQSRLIAGTMILLIVGYLVFSGQLSNIPSPVKRCQGCGRIYPIWRGSRVLEFHPPYRLWKPGEQGPEYPYSVLATYVCKDCTHQSVEIKAIYYSRVEEEIKKDTHIARVTYEDWLRKAPILESSINHGTWLREDEITDILIQAALLTRYSHVWLDKSIQFEFTYNAYDKHPDLINSPPAFYSNLLQYVDPPESNRPREFGSVFRTGENSYIIEWKVS